MFIKYAKIWHSFSSQAPLRLHGRLMNEILSHVQPWDDDRSIIRDEPIFDEPDSRSHLRRQQTTSDFFLGSQCIFCRHCLQSIAAVPWDERHYANGTNECCPLCECVICLLIQKQIEHGFTRSNKMNCTWLWGREHDPKHNYDNLRENVSEMI
jgi:hypothetical protein